MVSISHSRIWQNTKIKNIKEDHVASLHCCQEVILALMLLYNVRKKKEKEMSITSIDGWSVGSLPFWNEEAFKWHIPVQLAGGWKKWISSISILRYLKTAYNVSTKANTKFQQHCQYSNSSWDLSSPEIANPMFLVNTVSIWLVVNFDGMSQVASGTQIIKNIRDDKEQNQ